MSARGSKPSMREGPLSELFRRTDVPEAEVEDERPLPATIDRPTSGDPDGSGYVAVIRVVGIGGGGCNAVDRMVEAGISGVEFVAVNTDSQALEASDADVKIPIGVELTRGLGTGGDDTRGDAAVRESEEAVRNALRGSDLVFIAAGEGGGTGTGGAPVLAKIAREMGALTVAVVTRPFTFEGGPRVKAADRGVEALKDAADTVIVIPNDRLMNVLERGTSVVDAFRVCDDLLRQGVQGICDLITLPGLINLDFADVRTIVQGAGGALLGIGYAGGGNRAAEAAHSAITSPLLETPIDGARGILLGVTGGSDLSLVEVSEAAQVVSDAADPDANIIFGATIDDTLEGQVWVTVVATGFNADVAATNGGGGPGSKERSAPEPAEDLEPPDFVLNPGGRRGRGSSRPGARLRSEPGGSAAVG